MDLRGWAEDRGSEPSSSFRNKKGCLRGVKPLFKKYFPLMIGKYIHIMERGIKGGKVDMTVKEGLPRTKEGLPKEAFAIVGDPEDTETWKLPHHKKSIFRALRGKVDIEKTVDWERMPAVAAALSPKGYRGRRVDASPEQILAAAKHLAGHYLKADKPLPDILAALA